jgi:FlaA1/EpsC-like NDP-sugar epimerase
VSTINIFKGKTILVTGGAGSIGQALVEELMKHQPFRIRVLDLDETRIFDMDQRLTGGKEHKMLRFLLGDVKDQDRIIKAAEGVDIIFHLAALKHVVGCEYNPEEAVKTNVIGCMNVIKAALANNVERVIYTSSDKAAEPYSTMGTTKLVAERLFNAANWSRGKRKIIFASVRFGNVMGTRGGVIPLWKNQILCGKALTITDPEMQRFMMSMNQAVKLILTCATNMKKGGGTFILKMPVINVGDLAGAILDEYDKENIIPMKTIGRKPGETKFELLMSDKEREIATEHQNYYFIKPFIKLFERGFNDERRDGGDRAGWDSRYTAPLSREELKIMLKKEGLI